MRGYLDTCCRRTTFAADLSPQALKSPRAVTPLSLSLRNTLLRLPTRMPIKVFRNFINLTTARTNHAATYNFAYNIYILIMIDSFALHMSTPETHIPPLPPPPHRITPETPEHRLIGYHLYFSVSQLLYIVSKRSDL